MQSKATTVAKYLAELPPERRAAVSAVRQAILKNLGKGYAECMSYGMIGYVVPKSVYPPGYHCDPKLPLPFAGLASQKNHMAVYLMCSYGQPNIKEWLSEEFAKAGKKLNMGGSCIRFKKLDDLPLDVIGKAIKQVPVDKFIERYELLLGGSRALRAKPAKTANATTAKKAKTAKTAANAAQPGRARSTSRRKA